MDKELHSGQAIVSSNIPPTVSVIGCGGAGINMVRKTITELSDRAIYRYIDTSEGNLRAGEPRIIIKGASGGTGSGLDRGKNLKQVQQAMVNITDEELGLAEVVIVVFALSGGSGSVIGPSLVKEVKRRGKLVIAMVISSTQSEKHTENTFGTLKTLENFTRDIYLPITIFDNRYGESVVNDAMPYKINRLVDLLTLPTIELDKTDRLHWVDAPKVVKTLTTGMRLLRVEDNSPEESIHPEIWPGTEGYIFDSVLSIRAQGQGHRLEPKTRVIFDGEFTTVRLVPMIGIIGNPPDAIDDLIKSIKDILTQYGAQSTKRVSVVDVDEDEIDEETGFVL